MIFTSSTYIIFFIFVLIMYWSFEYKQQNVFLLVSSFIFYGYVTPWFCLLLASSIIVDFYCGNSIYNQKGKKKYLYFSLLFNMSLLAIFKYYNFFIENFIDLFNTFGISLPISPLNIILPVGISFYTFQTMSYTIDIYRGKLKPSTNLIDFAVFVSFFPQLVAGPIERAGNILPQIIKTRHITNNDINEGIYLIIRGFVKKLVVADNIALYVDKIFLLDSANLLLVAVGSVGFGIQIYADFSAYTDIARGSAKLLGFHLMENFKSPYLACSPSDFWRRWHISLSTWIRDYLYIPLSSYGFKTVVVLFITMGLSGLWHGAAWNYVCWGIYHGFLLVVYFNIGLRGNKQPKTMSGKFLAIAIMFALTTFGWSLFRTPNLEWLFISLFGDNSIITENSVNNSIYIFSLIIFYSIPLYLYKLPINKIKIQSLWAFFCIVIPIIQIIIFHQEDQSAFIYFQF